MNPYDQLLDNPGEEEKKLKIKNAKLKIKNEKLCPSDVMSLRLRRKDKKDWGAREIGFRFFLFAGGVNNSPLWGGSSHF